MCFDRQAGCRYDSFHLFFASLCNNNNRNLAWNLSPKPKFHLGVACKFSLNDLQDYKVHELLPAKRLFCTKSTLISLILVFLDMLELHISAWSAVKLWQLRTLGTRTSGGCQAGKDDTENNTNPLSNLRYTLADSSTLHSVIMYMYSASNFQMQGNVVFFSHEAFPACTIYGQLHLKWIFSLCYYLIYTDIFH